MIHGTIFDVYPDYQQDVMVIWLLTRRGARKIIDVYHPCFYVEASTVELRELSRKLKNHPQIQETVFTKVFTLLDPQRPRQVLKITPKRLQWFRKAAEMIDSWGNYHTYRFYDVDLRLPTRYLEKNQVFFNAQVIWTGTSFQLQDTQWAVDYPPPSFSTMCFSLTRNQKKQIPSPNDTIAQIQLNETIVEEDNERDCMLTAVRCIKDRDPDIIYTKHGDSMLFPFLLHRAQAQGISSQIIFGREKNIPVRSMKQASSYMSYGRIIHRPAFYTLKGRAHIDQMSSFFYSESGVAGLLDVSRCANLSLQLLSRLGAGTAISQIQVNTARKMGGVIPWKKNLPETWKTAENLLQSDRGGLILDPFVGIHEHVIELDFASLYPNIMVLHKISPETLLCSCCPESTHQVPQLQYHICQKQPGFLPQVLTPILDRRFRFKARMKHPCYDTKRYAQLQQAWKWVLLVCFGYTGYKNARFGRIECHESITAFSREKLLTALHCAEQAGYIVLHGIIDSLWIKGVRPTCTPEHLARDIGRKAGIRMDVEGTYHWIVFLPNKQSGVGALNRYYGVFEDGTIKTRGIELRQHSTPPFFKQMQQDMLTVMQKKTSCAAVCDEMDEVVEVCRRAAAQLRRNRVSPEQFIITSRVAKEISSYQVNTAVKAALQQFASLGVTIHPGQRVQFVITDQHAMDPWKKVCIAEFLTKDTSLDVSFYLRFLARCMETMLSPFGYTFNRCFQLIQ